MFGGRRCEGAATGSATDARDVTIGNRSGRWSFIVTAVFDPAAPARTSASGAFTGARLKIGSSLDMFLDGQMDSRGRR